MSTDGLSARSPSTGDLIRLIDKTRFAISTEETRYYLNGLYLHTVVENGISRCCARGHRRPPPGPGRDARARGRGRRPRASSSRARPSTRSAACSTTAGETGRLPGQPQKIRFEFGQASLTSKVIDGSFPDYMRVIPKDNQKIRPSTTPCSPRPSTASPPSRPRRAAR
jgi:DNA polymerase-3 subunit beta